MGNFWLLQAFSSTPHPQNQNCLHFLRFQYYYLHWYDSATAASSLRAFVQRDTWSRKLEVWNEYKPSNQDNIRLEHTQIHKPHIKAASPYVQGKGNFLIKKKELFLQLWRMSQIVGTSTNSTRYLLSQPAQVPGNFAHQGLNKWEEIT